MKTDKKGNTVIIKDTEQDVVAFKTKLSTTLQNYPNENVIIDLTAYKEFELDAIFLFGDLLKERKALKKSFVIVLNNFDFDKVPDEMIVVPTVMEAHDIIEMEEIERDLGF